MHHCLLIPELVHLICNEIRTGLGPESEICRTLLSLALTSRLWSDAALDCLWYRVEGIEPLFRCMPEDLWRVEEREIVCTLFHVCCILFLDNFSSTFGDRLKARMSEFYKSTHRVYDILFSWILGFELPSTPSVHCPFLALIPSYPIS